MVLQKRLDYGSSGYHIPAMLPHVPRSAKGKRSIRKKAEENPLCAFDLLAAVAGELLERENFDAPFITGGTSNSPSAKDCVQQEQLKKEQTCGAQVFDYLSSNKSTLGSQSVLNRPLKHTVNSSQIPNTASRHSLVLINTSDKEASSGKLVIDDTDGNVGQSLGIVQEKCDSPVSTEFCKYKVDDGIKTPLRAERRATGSMMDGIVAGMCSVEDLMDLDTKTPALVSSDSSVEVPLHGDRIVARNTSFPNHGNGMKLNVNRDDDENSSGCTHPSTISKSYRTQLTGDRKIRKFLGSKYRKVATSMLNDGEFSDTEMKLVSGSRKMCYTRQRTQRGLFKRRKSFERCTISASDEAVLSEDTSSSPVKGHIKIEPNDSDETQHGANGASSSSTGQKSSYCSEDFQVKFSIKSFKVPELLLEIPENSTIGSLKRMVMEAVTALLGGGFRVGVLRQGKKVRDDTRTLLQAGISHGGQLDNLGFTLEPNPTKAPTPLTTPKESQFFPSCKPAEPITRIADAVIPADQGASKAILHPQLTPVVNFPESDHDYVHSPADLLSLDNTAANSKALVPVPAVSVEALAVVPMRKSRRSELVQRRIRRPFSVAEVEALVHAVEKLGTGRWRDVKLRAFDNAKHRTYVDLKDKWKTLVHTARISPQQRRGEPVPQELLDRVLAAHAYWSQQQAKLQVKSPPAESCLLT